MDSRKSCATSKHNKVGLIITHKSAYRALRFAPNMNALVVSITLLTVIANNIAQCHVQQSQQADHLKPSVKHKTNQTLVGTSPTPNHSTLRREASLVADVVASNKYVATASAAIDGDVNSLPSRDTNKAPEANDNEPIIKQDISDDSESLNNNKKQNTNGNYRTTTTTSFSEAIQRSYGRVNRMRAYHLDLHSYRKAALYSGDPSYVDSNDPQHVQRCRIHLSHFHNLLSSFKKSDPLDYKNSMASIRLADTFGRPESGLLLGNQFWLGSYESCLDLKLSNPFYNDFAYVQTTTEGQFYYSKSNQDHISKAANSFVLYNESATLNTQYCIGLAQFPDWNPQDTKITIRIGLCLPETCTSSMLNNNEDLFHVVESMVLMNNFEAPFDKLKVRSIYCLPHETSEARKLSTSGILYVTLVGAILVTVIVSTFYDYFDQRIPDNLKLIQQEHAQERSWRRVVVESFSLIRNYEKYATLNQSDESNVVTELNEDGEPIYRFNKTIFFNSIAAIKCIGLLWIIAAHTFLVSPIPSRNLVTMDKLTSTYLANVFLTSHLMVDTFFTISGLIASYLIFKSGIEHYKLKHWVTMTIHRYWRLTPVYLMTYWFTKSLGQHMSTGPLWDYGTAAQSPRLQCTNESWWVAILHLSDFKSPKDHCVPFAWFTANNFKFWLVTPFFLLMIAKSMRFGYRITIGTVVANIILVIFLAMSSSVDMKSVIEFRPESADDMLNTMGQVYTRPYSRIGAYLIGLLAGHMIYRVDVSQSEIKISKNTKIVIWTLFSATIAVLTFIFKLVGGVQLEDSMIPWVFSISSSLIRPLWALCTCWFIYALAIGQARWISKFLNADFWRYLVKLSFCAYLLQGEVIASMYLNQIHSGVYTYSDVVLRPILTIVTTIFVSFLVVLLLEYPLTGIEELILPKKRTVSKSTQAHSVPTTKEENPLPLNAKMISKEEKLKCS